MDKARDLLRRRQSYERIDNGSTSSPAEPEEEAETRVGKPEYSWIDYSVFMLLGIAMLWAWNMFLAAAPYFQRRFRSKQSILSNFQAAEVSVSTVANLGVMMVLTKLQANASYPRRVVTSLLINIIGFTLLALSTKIFTGVSAVVYFVFAMIMIFASSTATGFMQNGAFALAAGLGRPEYLQAIMTGQAVAGVLPPIVQIASVLSAGETRDEDGQESSTSAMAYFFTATGVSAITLLAFFYLTASLRRRQGEEVHDGATEAQAGSDDDLASSAPHGASPSMNSVPLSYLARRLIYPAAAVFLTFGITMVFPVFTQEIISVSPNPSALFRPASFIPLAFLIWNIGDLVGRLVPLVPRLSLATRPKILLLLSIIRVIFIPLYLLCNIQPAKPLDSVAEAAAVTVKSDTFYFLVVQLPFGLTNGYLGSCCMMGAGAFVEEEEREAAGGFMGLMLVAGLAVGSLCSFFVGNT